MERIAPPFRSNCARGQDEISGPPGGFPLVSSPSCDGATCAFGERGGETKKETEKRERGGVNKTRKQFPNVENEYINRFL